MPITLVQKNGSASTGTITATPPAWGTTTTAGNLLVIVGCEVNGTNNTWPTSPAGYTAMSNTPFNYYAAGITGSHGGYYKIAAGADATPGVYGESTGTADWVTYTYEFAVDGGWINPPADQEQRNAASSTQVTSLAALATGALKQVRELAVCIVAHDIAVTSPSLTNYTLELPTTNNGKLQFGWQETQIATPVGFTASWTTLARCGIKQFTYRPRSSRTFNPKSVRRTGSGS
jgi:hypothetical protein